MSFLSSWMQAQKLVDSKQNRENSIGLIGTDKQGNETFLQRIDSSMTVCDLKIPDGIVKLEALAFTKI